MIYESHAKTVLEKCGIILSDKEKLLIEELRKIQYGNVTVYLQHGQPIRIERVLESIVL